MKIFNSVIPLLLVLFSAAACSDGPILNDGEWEMTTQMEIPGMAKELGGQEHGLPPMIHHQCLSSDMMVPTQERRNKDCENMKQDISGNTVTWSMRCTTNGVASEMSGESVYSGNTMKGTMQMSTQGTKMISHVTGKRIGPCK